MAGVALVAAVDAVLCLNGSFGHGRGTAPDQAETGPFEKADVSTSESPAFRGFMRKVRWNDGFGIVVGKPRVNQDIMCVNEPQQAIADDAFQPKIRRGFGQDLLGSKTSFLNCSRMFQ